MSNNPLEDQNFDTFTAVYTKTQQWLLSSSHISWISPWGELISNGLACYEGTAYNSSTPLCTQNTEEIEALPPFEATEFKQAENFWVCVACWQVGSFWSG